jgi:hypothetical protein
MDALRSAAFAFLLLHLGCLNALGQRDLTPTNSLDHSSTTSNEVADSVRVVAHFMCIWPESDSLVDWTIVRELIPPDCEHFMDESTTDMGQEECTDQIAFRSGNFMHFPATQPGVYMFFGVMPDSSKITYSAVVRLGEDILEDWQGASTESGIPLANMNWLETHFLLYPFCD